MADLAEAAFGSIRLGLLFALTGTMVDLWADLGKLTRLGVGDVMAPVGAAACLRCIARHGASENIHQHARILTFGDDFQYRGAVPDQSGDGHLAACTARPHIVGQSWLGLVSQLGGYLALTYALGHLPATITSVSLLTQGPLDRCDGCASYHRAADLAAKFWAECWCSLELAWRIRQRHPEEEANI